MASKLRASITSQGHRGPYQYYVNNVTVQLGLCSVCAIIGKIQKWATFIELLFVFVEAVFVAPRSEELGIAT